jgi:hypothetical protein
MLGMERGGADVIELGVPFSDPIADGRAIQEANTVSLSWFTLFVFVIGWIWRFGGLNEIWARGLGSRELISSKIKIPRNLELLRPPSVTT